MSESEREVEEAQSLLTKTEIKNAYYKGQNKLLSDNILEVHNIFQKYDRAFGSKWMENKDFDLARKKLEYVIAIIENRLGEL